MLVNKAYNNVRIYMTVKAMWREAPLSNNPRMVWVGKDIKDHLNPTPALAEAVLYQVYT